MTEVDSVHSFVTLHNMSSAWRRCDLAKKPEKNPPTPPLAGEYCMQIACQNRKQNLCC